MILRASLERIVGKFGGGAADAVIARLARGASGTFGLKIASMVLSFAVNVALGRVLGAEHYGVYVYVFGWMTLAAVPVSLGFDRLLVREVAAESARDSWPSVFGIIRYANWSVALASSLAAIAAATIGYALVPSRPAIGAGLMAGAALIPLVALAKLRQSALQGLHAVVSAQVPELVLRPVLFLALIGISVIAGRTLDGSSALVIQVLATAGAFVVGIVLLRRALPARPASIAEDSGRWRRLAMPMLFFAALTAANSHADALLVGTFAGAEAAGLYAAAALGAGLISFPLMAVNIAFAPAAATLHARGDLAQLQRITTLSSRVMTATALPITLFFLFAGEWFLSMFGAEFARAEHALMILSVGQLFNVATGSVGILLLMTGNEDAAARTLGLSVLAKILLGVLLIPAWGLMGAALVSGVCIVGWNLSLAFLVRKRLGVRPSVF